MAASEHLQMEPEFDFLESVEEPVVRVVRVLLLRILGLPQVRCLWFLNYSHWTMGKA
jgi:hypothetical protein